MYNFNNENLSSDEYVEFLHQNPSAFCDLRNINVSHVTLSLSSGNVQAIQVLDTEKTNDIERFLVELTGVEHTKNTCYMYDQHFGLTPILVNPQQIKKNEYDSRFSNYLYNGLTESGSYHSIPDLLKKPEVEVECALQLLQNFQAMVKNRLDRVAGIEIKGSLKQLKDYILPKCQSAVLQKINEEIKANNPKAQSYLKTFNNIQQIDVPISMKDKQSVIAHFKDSKNNIDSLLSSYKDLQQGVDNQLINETGNIMVQRLESLMVANNYFQVKYTENIASILQKTNQLDNYFHNTATTKLNLDLLIGIASYIKPSYHKENPTTTDILLNKLEELQNNEKFFDKKYITTYGEFLSKKPVDKIVERLQQFNVTEQNVDSFMTTFNTLSQQVKPFQRITDTVLEKLESLMQSNQKVNDKYGRKFQELSQSSVFSMSFDITKPTPFSIPLIQEKRNSNRI